MGTARITKILEARTLSLHIQRFIDRIRGNEARGSRDFIMPMADAKGLHADLTNLLLELNTLKTQQLSSTQEIVQVEINGGRFK